jgi:hypothetical protein
MLERCLAMPVSAQNIDGCPVQGAKQAALAGLLVIFAPALVLPVPLSFVFQKLLCPEKNFLVLLGHRHAAHNRWIERKGRGRERKSQKQ